MSSSSNPVVEVPANLTEIEQQVAIAKRYPRDVNRFSASAKHLATLDQDTAVSCIYALRRKDRDGNVKLIEGPSARLAEIVASQWENADYGARVVGDDGEFVTAQGAFRDLEHNTRCTFDVKRSITTRSGHRFSTDMIGVTSNAACSIALRNAILKGIPRGLWEPVYQAARMTAAGKAKELPKRRERMLEEFAKWKVTPEQVCALLHVESTDEIDLDKMVTIGGVYTAIRDGDATVESIFRAEPETGDDEEMNQDLGISDEGDPDRTE